MSKSPKAAITPMTLDAAARIQSSTAKKHGGGVPKGSFAARSQRAAAKNKVPPPRGNAK